MQALLSEDLIGVVEIDEAQARADFCAGAQRHKLRRVIAKRIVGSESRWTEIGFTFSGLIEFSGYIDEMGIDCDGRLCRRVENSRNERRKTNWAFNQNNCGAQFP